MSINERRAAVWRFMGRGLSPQVMAAILGVAKVTIEEDIRWLRARLNEGTQA